MRVYLAGPLFNTQERALNDRLTMSLEKNGIEVYLPQRNGALAFDEIKKGADPKETRDRVFKLDVQKVRDCDAIVCVMDGRVPDEGMCIELGMAFILGKKCVGFKTDVRTMDVYGDNVMVEGSLEKVVSSEKELLEFLRK